MEDSGKNDRLSTINPPFPSDVPTAPLLRLSLEKLLNNDTEESTRFYQACKNLGFFYLDLRGTSIGESILKDADRLFDVGEKLFELDLEEKEKYDFSAQHSYYGYGACH
jgi:isopenicillin N synthase-like dioxygenase